MFRICLKMIVFIALCLTILFAYEKISPFRLGKCRIEIAPNRSLPTESQSAAYHGFLRQPFTYLSEGTQAYVFLSQDQTIVLKLFKNVTGVEKTLEACKLAYEIRDLTEVVFIHLNPKPGLPTIAIKDEWGRTHWIDPAHMRFILQRKANPFFKTLRNASKEERLNLIQSFYSLLQDMSSRGIANLDDSLGRNFGFIDGKAVAIDFGKFVYAPKLTEEREAHLARRLNTWLLKNHLN